MRTRRSLLLLLTLLLSPALLAQNYRYERLWPALQQPWYFVNTRGLAIDRSDNTYVVDSFNHRVHRFSKDGQLINRFGQFGVAAGEFSFPLTAAADADGNLYVSETDSGSFRRIQKFTGEGEPLLAFGAFGSGDGEFGETQQLSPFDLEVDNAGHLLASGDGRIQRFAPDGTFVSSFGRLASPAVGDDEFEFVTGLAVDRAGRIYVADGGNAGDIHVFDAGGNFITRFGSQGAGPGQVDRINDLHVLVDSAGNERLLIAESGNSRIQNIDLPCALALADPTALADCVVATWGTPGRAPGEFQLLWRVASDSAGLVYTVDVDGSKDFGIHRVQKFTADGVLLNVWTSGGTGPLELASPSGLAVSGAGTVFVADTDNQRVQVYSPLGQPLRSIGSAGSGNGEFLEPFDVDLGPGGEVFVLDFGRDPNNPGTPAQPSVQRFTALGQFDNLKFGSFGTGPGQFQHATDMALGQDGSIYVVDSDLNRVQKFSPTGQFELAWGGTSACFDAQGFPQACNDGEFNSSRGIAVDRSGSQDVVVVADTLNQRLQRFDPDGNLLSVVNVNNLPVEVSVGPAGRLFYVPFSDSRSATGHIVVEIDSGGQEVDFFGGFGSNPGQFRSPAAVDFGDDGRAYIADALNNRVQVFVPSAAANTTQAIIVTGGGPYPGNALWPATQLNANFVYRTLIQQGFSKDQITYLSADQDLDLDQNGLPDDVDGDASNANLAAALAAAGDEDLLLYLVDHGGSETFRMAGSEVLGAPELAAQVNQWQSTNPAARLTFVYDACQSGSFLGALRNPSFERVLITSAAAPENAYFVAQGSLSFSTFFFNQIFNGASLRSAFEAAQQSVQATFTQQSPQLDADGDGTRNTPQDLAAISSRFIGNGTQVNGSGPTIGSVSAPQTISGSTATVEAFGIDDDDRIARVWAVVRPPDFQPGSPDNPVQDLPTFDLAPTGDRFSAVYNRFDEAGTWQLAIYAQDSLGNRSLPSTTSVTVGNPRDRKAVLIASGGPSGTLLGPASRNADTAYRALLQQGYGPAGATCGGGSVCDRSCDRVCFLSDSGTAGFDAAPSLANVQEAITQWAGSNVQDLTVYLIAPGSGATGYELSSGETLTAAALDGWLDSAQSALTGNLVLVVDGDDSEPYLAATLPAPGLPRVLIGSTGAGENASFLQDGRLSFSGFFFNQVLNGAAVRDAFTLARTAVGFATRQPRAVLDDNGNGVANEFVDGLLAREVRLGSGVLLAGDNPVVDGLAVNDPLTSDFESIVVNQVTTTGAVDQVLAVVAQPGGTTVTQPLVRQGASYAATAYGLCGPAGSYEVAVFAVDAEGQSSLPVTAAVNRVDACEDLLFLSGFE